MCGLVGIAGELAIKDELTMRRLLLLDYFRGPDSTGVAGIALNGDAKIAKISSNPVDLFNMSSFKEAMKGPMSKAFMGHNRLATRGAVNTVNAHPFHYGSIIGMHNGTLETKDKWALEDALGEKFDVDSQALFAAIDRLGIDTVIPMLTSGDVATNSSAWALVWYDQKDGTLNFLRNQHRPLWYGLTKDFKHLFWASEWEMIDGAVKLGGPYDIYVEAKTSYKYWPFETDIHYQFDLAELRKGGDTRPKPKAKPLKGKEPTPVASTGGSNPFGRVGPGFTDNHSTSTGGGSTRSTRSTTTSPGQTLRNRMSAKQNKDKIVNHVHLIGSNDAPFAGWLRLEDFRELAKFGCSWCQRDIASQTPGVTVYSRDDLILCPTCSGYQPGDETSTRIIVPGPRLDAML